MNDKKTIGCPSDLDPSRMLTYDGGKVIPREWFEDSPTQWALDAVGKLTDEQIYEVSLRSGLSRDLRVEAQLEAGKERRTDSHIAGAVSDG